jgi:hypothetical protein
VLVQNTTRADRRLEVDVCITRARVLLLRWAYRCTVDVQSVQFSSVYLNLFFYFVLRSEELSRVHSRAHGTRYLLPPIPPPSPPLAPSSIRWGLKYRTMVTADKTHWSLCVYAVIVSPGTNPMNLSKNLGTELNWFCFLSS